MSVESHPSVKAAGRPNIVIATMCGAVVLIIAAVASLSVALPIIGRDLDASQSDLQWIVDAFAITLAALLLPMGVTFSRVIPARPPSRCTKRSRCTAAVSPGRTHASCTETIE
jgi:MFS family permease